MKRVAIIILALICCVEAHGQYLAIGERTPSWHSKFRNWASSYTPAEEDYTYIGFVHSKSRPCRRGIERIGQIAARRGDMRILIFTKESEANAEAWLKEYTSGNAGVAYDCEYVFRSFGVNYAPFGVIVNRRRKVLWFGNPTHLTEEQIFKFSDKEATQCHSQK